MGHFGLRESEDYMKKINIIKIVVLIVLIAVLIGILFCCAGKNDEQNEKSPSAERTPVEHIEDGDDEESFENVFDTDSNEETEMDADADVENKNGEAKPNQDVTSNEDIEDEPSDGGEPSEGNDNSEEDNFTESEDTETEYGPIY